MSENAHHCPFLDRADCRCSAHFSLDRLGHAFGFCFGSYRTCPVYAELLSERRPGRVKGASDAAGPIVQLTIPHRYAKRQYDPAVVSAAPGV